MYTKTIDVRCDNIVEFTDLLSKLKQLFNGKRNGAKDMKRLTSKIYKLGELLTDASNVDAKDVVTLKAGFCKNLNFDILYTLTNQNYEKYEKFIADDETIPEEQTCKVNQSMDWCVLLTLLKTESQTRLKQAKWLKKFKFFNPDRSTASCSKICNELIEVAKKKAGGNVFLTLLFMTLWSKMFAKDCFYDLDDFKETLARKAVYAFFKPIYNPTKRPATIDLGTLNQTVCHNLLRFVNMRVLQDNAPIFTKLTYYEYTNIFSFYL